MILCAALVWTMGMTNLWQLKNIKRDSLVKSTCDDRRWSNNRDSGRRGFNVRSCIGDGRRINDRRRIRECNDPLERGTGSEETSRTLLESGLLGERTGTVICAIWSQLNKNLCLNFLKRSWILNDASFWGMMTWERLTHAPQSCLWHAN